MRRLLIALLLSGCVADVDPLLGTATSTDGGVPSVEPTATTVGDRVTLYAPRTEPRRVLQGGRMELVATDLGYMVMFRENIEGRVSLSVLALDTRGRALAETTELATQSLSFSSEVIAAQDDEVGVFFSGVEGTIWMSRLDFLGRSLGPRIPVLTEVGFNAPVQKVLSTPRGYVLAWLDDRFSPRVVVPFVVQISVQGQLIGQQVRVRDGLRPGTSRSIGAIVSGSEGLSIAWAERAAGDRDYVYLSQVEASQISSPVEVYSGDAVIGGTTIVLQDESLLSAVWDLDEDGVYTIHTVDGLPRAPQRLPVDIELKRPQLADTAGGSVALLASAGALRVTNPISTELYFVLLDPAGNLVHSQLHLNPESGGQRCIEDFAMAKARNEDAFGVVWTEGCSQRRMYFARVEFTP